MSELRPTLGIYVAPWMESFLVHSQGDYLGQPFRLNPWQRALVYEMYELEDDGSRKYDRVVLGLPKGNGKSELAAAISVVELKGPVVCTGFDDAGTPLAAPRVSPDIPVAAASYDQAEIVFGAAAAMIEKGPLADHFDVFEREITPKDGDGRLYRVAAVAGPNDGLKPTFFAADEVHEWTGRKERVHLVISNGRAKRKDSWELNISTAGWQPGSLLGRMYKHGREVMRGEAEDPRLLFRWWEAKGEHDLSDDDGLRAAIQEANPATDEELCGGNPFLDLESVAARYSQVPEFEFRRYHLNQWTSAPDSWLPAGVWDRCADPARTVAADEKVVVGFDGSWRNDSTALVGCTVDDPHVFVLGHWENPGKEDWRVSVPDVEERIREVCRDYNVLHVGCDPSRWQHTISHLTEEGLPMLEWPSHLPSAMVPACSSFYDAVVGDEPKLTHDGNKALARHMANGVVKEDSRGARITKDRDQSARKIDLAVAAIIAYDMAIRETPQDVSRYEDPEAEVFWV